MTQLRLILVLAGAAVLAASLVAASLLSTGEAKRPTPAPAASGLLAGVQGTPSLELGPIGGTSSSI